MNNSFYNYHTSGITQGLLAKFMNCREETRLFLQGWNPKAPSSPALMYGTIIHGILERIYDDIRTSRRKVIPNDKDIAQYVRNVGILFKKENPSLSNEGRKLLEYSLLIAEAVVPGYLKRWWKHDATKVKWQKLEQQFKIPYCCKDGRKTFLRGKIDGVFTNPGLWLFESKSKSLVNEGNLIDTLSYEHQNNLYLRAARELYKKTPSGILYNIIRKSGMERKKTESLESFGDRLKKDILKRPEFYFIRYEIVVTPAEMARFDKELEGMIVDFMDWCEGKRATYKNTAQCLTKYGRCPMLQICSSGSYVQHAKRKVVFQELSGDL